MEWIAHTLVFDCMISDAMTSDVSAPLTSRRSSSTARGARRPHRLGRQGGKTAAPEAATEASRVSGTPSRTRSSLPC